MRIEFTKEEQLTIMEKLGFKCLIANRLELRYLDRTGKEKIITSPASLTMRCSCKQGQQNPLPSTIMQECLYCKSKYAQNKTPILVPKPVVEEAKHKLLEKQMFSVREIDSNLKKYKQKYNLHPFYVIEFDKEEKNTMYIFLCKANISLDDEGKSTASIDIKTVTKVIAGKPYEAYKISNSKFSTISPYQALDINTETNKRKVVFMNFNTLDDLFQNESEFAKITGLKRAQEIIVPHLKKYKGNTLHSWFIFYLALLSRYPVIDQILKMGYEHMVLEVYMEVLNSRSAQIIEARVNNLTRLIKNETKGNKALTLPNYAAKILEEYKASFTTFKDFAKLCDLDKTLTLQAFEKLKDDEDFKTLIQQDIEYVIESMLYFVQNGYRFIEALKYLSQQKSLLPKRFRYNNYWMVEVARLLRDYIQMCKTMNIIPEKKPKNLLVIHDALAKQIEVQQDKKKDEKLAAIANRYKPIADSLNASMGNKYMVLLPESTKDFMDEGVSQHNCVGSYVDRVAAGQTLVFFIREKKEHETSLVTAECAHGILRQLYYSYNRTVADAEIRNLAYAFVRKVNQLDAKTKPVEFDGF